MRKDLLLLFVSCIAFGHINAQINSRHREPVIQDTWSQQQPKQQHKLWQAAKVPTMLITLGIASTYNHDVINRYEVREERNEHMPDFQHKADNYLMHAPILFVYGLNIAGVKGKNDFRNRTLLLLKSEMIMAALTFSLKGVTSITRPDNSTHDSFPSGHTAQAFATATFMAKEYGDQSVWYTVGAYSMATTVGVMRVLNNRHWISDVMAGAGIGILATNLAYLTHRYRWANKNSNLTVVPMYTSGPGLYVGYRFN